MSLAVAYTQAPQKRAVNTLIVAHFDAHGVAFAAARYSVLRQRGEEVEVISRFPVTGPQGLSSGSIKEVIDNVAPQRIEVIDIPIDVRNPDAAIKTLADLATVAPVYYYDHHETDAAFVARLHRAGIFASVFGDNVAMASALELFSNDVARYLAIVGMVADRDRSVLKIVSREKVEQEYLPAANRLDILVRQPRLVGVSSQGELAKELVRRGPHNILVYERIEYPPETLARQLAQRIMEEGEIAILVDWSDQPFAESQWTPKTLEQLLLMRRRYIAVAVTPGYNPMTKAQEGWDVRVLRYWLAPETVPEPEQVAKDLIAQKAIQGKVIGHADYVSIRFDSLEEATRAARQVYRTIEGMEPATTHLVNDRYVAEAVRRDYQRIIELLTRIAEALERGAAAKEEQVRLLKQLHEHEREIRHD